MYIRSVHIENIRSIETFDMAFEEGREAGWHVLIGENGSGKTTIARCLAINLVGDKGFWAIRQDPTRWLRKGGDSGKTQIEVSQDFNNSGTSKSVVQAVGKYLEGSIEVVSDDHPTPFFFPDGTVELSSREVSSLGQFLELNEGSHFSSAFGPFRRFSGGDPEWSKVYKSNPRAGAHLSVFGEDIALTEIIPWLTNLRFQELDEQKPSITLKYLSQFINEGGLLPGNGRLSKIGHDGVFFQNGSEKLIDIQDLSDGYRSILSLTLELIRQLIRTYGEEKVFANIQKGIMDIPLPGVVIIDEVDAHLHPTWQVKIGQWFTKYFPQLQFIVTTHSPLICRACGDHGKIFKLAAPGSATPSGEITGVDRDRLVYGDILVAYETDAFGDGVEWGEESRMLQKEYRDLVYKRRFGVEMTATETARLERLTPIFRSHVEAD
jgi:energy-coupling factor transporter ATP-binding protein EcfA2